MASEENKSWDFAHVTDIYKNNSFYDVRDPTHDEKACHLQGTLCMFNRSRVLRRNRKCGRGYIRFCWIYETNIIRSIKLSQANHVRKRYLTSVLISHHADRSACLQKERIFVNINCSTLLKFIFFFKADFTSVEDQNLGFVLGFEVGANIHRRMTP